MAIQTYKFVKTDADANGSYDLGSIVQLDDTNPVATSLVNAGAIVKIAAPAVDAIPAPTDPPPIS